MRKTRVVRPAGKGGYGLTLHRDYHGEFDYDLQWKPIGGFPVTVGWINAIRRGQARLHRGLDVGVPNLILRSDHSVAETAGTEVMQRGDAVLDVAHIAQLGRLRRQPPDHRAGGRRQARRVPLAARAPRGGLPRTGPVAGGGRLTQRATKLPWNPCGM